MQKAGGISIILPSFRSSIVSLNNVPIKFQLTTRKRKKKKVPSAEGRERKTEGAGAPGEGLGQFLMEPSQCRHLPSLNPTPTPWTRGTSAAGRVTSWGGEVGGVLGVVGKGGSSLPAASRLCHPHLRQGGGCPSYRGRRTDV